MGRQAFDVRVVGEAGARMARAHPRN
jgi:hypothetical protein